MADRDVAEYMECIRLISDIHKEAHGRRPSLEWMDHFNGLGFDPQCETVDSLLTIAKRRNDEEEQAQRKHAYDFRCAIRFCIRIGAGNVNTALRWLTENEVFYGPQCVEQWVWGQGILFTPTGKAAVRRLIETTTFQEWED